MTMDVIVITYPKTLTLVRIFCESFAKYYHGPGKLYLFSEKEYIPALKIFGLPKNTEVISKEDILPDHSQFQGYLTQQYFKLYAHQIIQSDSYLVADDDFVFIRPTEEDHFFCQGKPIWFYQRWEYAGAGKVWKEPTEKFLEPLRIEQPFHFLTSNPTYIYLKDVVADLCNQIDSLKILEQKLFAEGRTYGSFAFARHRHRYNWINNYGFDEVLGGRVNQIPPDYLTLDPTVRFEEFSHFHFLSFWSHWSRSEEKMAEFLRRSQ